MSTKIVRNDSDQKLIAGIAKHLKKGTTLVVAGEKYTSADITKVLQRRIATAQVVVAQAGWRKAVAEERDLIDWRLRVATMRQVAMAPACRLAVPR
jgi:hypothetical protein